MNVTGHTGMWLARAVAAGFALALIAGCASSPSPEQAVPELDSRLAAVDRAISDHEFGRARRQIQRLVRATVAARETGDLDPDQAEPILAAAASLASALPRQQRPSESPSPQPAPEPDTDEGQQPRDPEPDAGNDEGEQEKRQDELEKKREELQKQREEEQKKEEEDNGGEERGGEEGGGKEGGRGESSENGHGN